MAQEPRGLGSLDMSAEATNLQYSEAIPPELTCGVCHRAFEDAVTLPCGHNFCRLCVSPWLKSYQACPECKDPTFLASVRTASQSLISALDNLVVFCGNKALGCAWSGLRGDLELHYSSKCEVQQQYLLEQVCPQVKREVIVDLNVGGATHFVSLSLLRSYPNSLLAKLFARPLGEVQKRDIGPTISVFLDRDPSAFAELLFFLRYGKNSSFEAYDLLLQEAAFWRIDIPRRSMKSSEIAKLLSSKVVVPDTDIQSAMLRGFNLSNAVMMNCNLSNSNMAGANFSNADLSNSHLVRANCERCIFSKCLLNSCDFSHANLDTAKFASYDPVTAQLQARGEISSSIFSHARLRGIDQTHFLNCDFVSATFEATALSFSECNLKQARITSPDPVNPASFSFKNCDLSKSKMEFRCFPRVAVEQSNLNDSHVTIFLSVAASMEALVMEGLKPPNSKNIISPFAATITSMNIAEVTRFVGLLCAEGGGNTTKGTSIHVLYQIVNSSALGRIEPVNAIKVLQRLWKGSIIPTVGNIQVEHEIRFDEFFVDQHNVDK